MGKASTFLEADDILTPEIRILVAEAKQVAWASTAASELSHSDYRKLARILDEIVERTEQA